MPKTLPLFPITHWLLKASMVIVALVAAILAASLAGIAVVAVAPDHMGVPALLEGVPLAGALAFGACAVAFGLAATAIVFFGLRDTAAIVGSAMSDDPFVDENAQRLTRIGWLLVALASIEPVTGWVLNPMAARIETAHRNIHIEGIDPDFSPISILTILLVFVLAQIFRRGAQMRSELEGTV